MLPTFAFQSASTSAELMSELEKFLVFWLGPRKEEFGEPEPVLREHRIPEQLRRLLRLRGPLDVSGFSIE